MRARKNLPKGPQCKYHRTGNAVKLDEPSPDRISDPEAFNSCKTTHFTVGGSIGVTGSFSFTQTTISGQETANGTLNVNATDGCSGSCALDFTIGLSGSLNSPAVTVSGTICGISANGIVT